MPDEDRPQALVLHWYIDRPLVQDDELTEVIKTWRNEGVSLAQQLEYWGSRDDWGVDAIYLSTLAIILKVYDVEVGP